MYTVRLILTKIKAFAISIVASPFNPQLLFSPQSLASNTIPQRKVCVTLLMMFVVITAHCVLCKVRNECHRWFNITHNVLHYNNSLIPDRPQQCHHKALFGFSIVLFHRNLMGRNSGHIPLQI